MKELQEAAHSLGRRVQVLEAHTQREIDGAFAASLQPRAGALFVASDGFFFARREQFAALAQRQRDRQHGKDNVPARVDTARRSRVTIKTGLPR